MHAPQIDPRNGLSSQTAAQRLATGGPNELSPPQRRGFWQILREVASEPMLQLLVAAGMIYLLLGDRGEALMLLAFVAVTLIISISQEHRTERVLQALRDLTSPRALVLRDGRAQRIAGLEVVCGDLLLLAEGDRVAADARLIEANDLETDESLLSGESLPVPKHVSATTEIGCVFAGSMVVAGQGLAEVIATGAASEIGRIGKSLGEISNPVTPLHQQTRRMVRLFSIIGLVLSLIVVLLYGLQRGNWLSGLLAGITLAMSLLPQEFFLILTVFMAMGAWRLSRQQVLTRRAATIEALGSATVLCTDKTGTLTLNRMAVAELLLPANRGEPQRWVAAAQPWQADFDELLEFALLASERQPFDAMEQALLDLGRAQLPEQALHLSWRLVHEYGLTPALPAMTHVWRDGEAGAAVVAVKGAPEALARLCRLPEPAAQAMAQQAQQMAGRGLRVLAVARASWVHPAWPDEVAGFDFNFLGLVAFADPLRSEVPAAINECHGAGIRVLMITGDHPSTAAAIATQAGLLVDQHAVVTGDLLAAMSAAELQHCVQTNQVFARIKPQQKLLIVEALKAQGEVVAMTGDGVNDAPSLKAAHIGIAMGGRGTDVAREASALVLLDDNFGAIVKAVRMGRRIFDNLHKALAFVLAVHVPIAGLSLLPLLLGWPLVLSPVHIAFLELLIDPVCSIVFEAEEEESDVMQRPPRDAAAPLLSKGLMAWSFLQGLLVLLAVSGLFAALLNHEVPADQARALTFAALVSCNVALILANRSISGSLLRALRQPNPLLWFMLAATASLLAAALWLPPLRSVFGFGLAPWPLLAGALGLGLAMLLALEALKRLRPRQLS
jgi:Ca2+-transporting ATPase